MAEMGPKERRLREQTEARAARAEQDRKAAAKTPVPSSSELREKIAAIKPKPRKAKKKAGRGK